MSEMTEAQLVADTIQAVKDGWTTCYLTDPDTGKHCLLGSIGYARWGSQWDIDCNSAAQTDKMYAQLTGDPVTSALVNRLADHIRAIGDSDYVTPSPSDCTVYTYNDDQSSSQLVLELLEKVQADFGMPVEGYDEEEE